MKLLPLAVFSVALIFLQACSHPIEIVGEGDVTSASGTRNCSLEDFQAARANCTKNYVVGPYQETYTATPRTGWQFDHWGYYCATSPNNTCSFIFSGAKVQEHWGETMPPLQAVFSKYKLTGPILPASGISLAAGAVHPSYQKQEFFLASTARSYTPALPLPTDGKLVVTADPISDAGNYKTRVVVHRPVDPEKFNGTVIVEWLNVTAGTDSAPDWIQAHNEFIRSGYAWVGVSAQAVGVNAIKANARYASLVHPGDSYSYDIFTLVGQLARLPAATLLGGLTAEHVLAAGESQSAFRMVTYIDAIQPIEHAYDGFLVHSRFDTGAAIAQAPLTAYPFPAPAPIRDDLDVPVFIVQTETDMIRSNLAARQADTSMIRLWELAGTAHADAYTLQGLNDLGDGSTAVLMFGFMRAPNNPFGCTNSINASGHHWTLQAAFHGLDNWVRTGVPPASGAPLDVVSSSPVVFARDAQGNALGGVRSPHVDVPVATLDSVNSGVSFCALFGRTIPLTTTQINTLYSSKTDFMTKWSASIDQQIENGFLLPADGVELEAAADAWQFPN